MVRAARQRPRRALFGGAVQPMRIGAPAQSVLKRARCPRFNLRLWALRHTDTLTVFGGAAVRVGFVLVRAARRQIETHARCKVRVRGTVFWDSGAAPLNVHHRGVRVYFPAFFVRERRAAFSGVGQQLTGRAAHSVLRATRFSPLGLPLKTLRVCFASAAVKPLACLGAVGKSHRATFQTRGAVVQRGVGVFVSTFNVVFRQAAHPVPSLQRRLLFDFRVLVAFRPFFTRALRRQPVSCGAVPTTPFTTQARHTHVVHGLGSVRCLAVAIFLGRETLALHKRVLGTGAVLFRPFATLAHGAVEHWLFRVDAVTVVVVVHSSALVYVEEWFVCGACDLRNHSGFGVCIVPSVGLRTLAFTPITRTRGRRDVAVGVLRARLASISNFGVPHLAHRGTNRRFFLKLHCPWQTCCCCGPARRLPGTTSDVCLSTLEITTPRYPDAALAKVVGNVIFVACCLVCNALAKVVSALLVLPVRPPALLACTRCFRADSIIFPPCRKASAIPALFLALSAVVHKALVNTRAVIHCIGRTVG